ncbi:Cif family virulence factor [Spirosoma agri]|uniref:Uncharacterized protein n=1 Tax=Spirosoma agri TaxID=1987381 RepID=A0A6M0IFT0_9BACT|nr:nuclear transport factor 2 family protein [Spirosoma agri]NEU67136.1 hypothetical protein [Spirosoma agri]
MKNRLYVLSFFLIQSLSVSFAQVTKDELAIRGVLEGHSRACLDADVTKAISYYARSPYVATAFDEPGYGRGYEAMTALYKKEFANGQKSLDKLTATTYRFRIVNNTAFVTYIEVYTKPDGTVSKVHKANYLEKEQGQWKIIGNFWIPEKTP